MLLLVTISILLVWFWTGVYSAFESSQYFYKAAPQVFAQATFWAVTILTTIICLLPRFCIKAVQKVYFPYDVDIIREQVRQGKFDYLENTDGSFDSKSKGSSTTSSEIVQPSKHTHYPSIDEDQRPIYPPSVAPTATTHNPRSQNGSDGTDFTRHRRSIEPPTRPSFDRPRPSFDRMRASMDRIRPSYEASNDFTSAALLTRLESSQSFGPIQSRRTDLSNDLR
jgi:phospholipid-translocating ATPase